MRTYSAKFREQILLIFMLIFICACNNSAPVQLSDSLAKKVGTDTTIHSDKKNDTTFEQVDLKSVLTDYYKMSRDTLKIDTTIGIDGKVLYVKFMHYCTNDSSIRLPERYIKYYNLKKFIASNFQSSLLVRTKDTVLFDTIIQKQLFNGYANSEEKLYGTLLYPNLKFEPDGLGIQYSFSIPLTDVGIGVSLNYKYYGKMTLRGD